jgi:REP element-mobilizing transposase RayT
MSTGYQILDQDKSYFLTFQIVGWIDIFSRKIYRDIIIESFKYSIEHKGFQVFAYVIMSNHVHLIAQSSNGKLSDNIRDIKKFTSRKIVNTVLSIQESRKKWMLDIFKIKASYHKEINNYQVWTHENHAVILSRNNFIWEKIEYIHNNPVRAGIVEKPEDYLYSSARNYASLEAPIDIPTLILLPCRTYR